MTHDETTALVRRANASGFESIADYAVNLECALERIADRAKYLSEPAWTLEGCALVGRQIYRWATEARFPDGKEAA